MAEQLALGLSLSGDGAAPARLRSRSQPLFAQGFARRIELRRAGGEWNAVGDEVAGPQAPSLYTSHGAGDVPVYADPKSGERSVGQEGVSTWRCRWSLYHSEQNKLYIYLNNTVPDEYILN